MWSLILSVFSVVVFLLSLVFCVWLGYRRGWFNTAVRIGCFILGGILSFVAAKLLAPVIATSLLPLITESLGEAAEFMNMPTLQNLLTKVVVGIISPLLFVLVFFLVEKLTFFIYFPLKKKFSDNEKLHNQPHDKLYGALLGVVLAIAITITWLMPISGYTYFVSTAVATFSQSDLLELSDETAELVEDFSVSPIAKIDRVFTGWLFRSLSTDLTSVTNTAVTFANVTESLTNDISNGKFPFDMLKEILSSKETSAIAISLLRDFLPTVVPSENAVASKLVGCVTTGLDNLLKAQQSLSDKEYQQEIESLTQIFSLTQEPSEASAVAVIETVLNSKFVSEAIAEQGDAIVQELNGETIKISKKEKKELQNMLEQYTGSEKVKDTVESLFALQ